MKDPKMKLTADISAQMTRDRYENWDVLLQRWAKILKNSEDYDVKKDHGQIQANASEKDEKDWTAKAKDKEKDKDKDKRMRDKKDRKPARGLTSD
jgi:hypothetical protein